jgi:DtxR family transcriptional regulator, Mn-dependent transcriptional regulator
MVREFVEGLSASLEDYLEVISNLEQCNRVARAKDIADQMNVQRASVTGALKALAAKGLINYTPYSYITLTAEGRRIAQDIIHRHDTLREFFMTTLQLDREQAEANACRVEHAIDLVAVERLVHFLEFIRICPRTGMEWADAFARFRGRGPQTASCSECLRMSLDQVSSSQNDARTAGVRQSTREP